MTKQKCGCISAFFMML